MNLDSPTNIQTDIQSIDIPQLAEEFNNCIINWFKKNKYLEENFALGEFKGCCSEDEVEIIKTCITIFLENYDNQNNYDINDIARGIIGYYYATMVLEYYIMNREGVINTLIEITENGEYLDNFGNKYKKIDAYDYANVKRKYNNVIMTTQLEKISSDGKKSDNKKYYADMSEGLPCLLYILNSLNGKLMYVKPKKEYDFSCFQVFFFRTQSKQIMEFITLNNEKWVSDIRRILLNLNVNGGGIKIKNKKKSKKNRKYLKRRNKTHKKIRRKRHIRGGNYKEYGFNPNIDKPSYDDNDYNANKGGGNIGPNCNDPNYSIYNTNLLKLFPYNT